MDMRVLRSNKILAYLYNILYCIQYAHTRTLAYIHIPLTVAIY